MPLSQQAIFDKVWQHFVVEKNPRATQKYHNVDRCAYLTPDGHKCAVGIFIPDGHPAQQFVGSASTLLGEYPDLRRILNGHGSFLNNLQSAHDGDWSNELQQRIGDIEQALRRVAKHYDLTIPSEAHQ